MQIPQTDTSQLLKYLLPALVLGLAMLYLVLRTLILYVWQATEAQRQRIRANRFRKPPATKPVIVRKTDLYSQLTAQQKKAYQYAEALELRKQWIEAAKIFDAIGFQRRAIDILEKNGFVDEACTILIRMGVVSRAAIVYERNGHFYKAAVLFAKDGKHEQAGQNYEKLAIRDFNFLREAGRSYMEGGCLEQALQIYARLDDHERVLQLCLQHKLYSFLQDYVALGLRARLVLPQLNEPELTAMVTALAFTPQSALYLAHWLMYRPDALLIHLALEKLSTQRDLAKLFWQQFNDRYMEHITQHFAKQSTAQQLAEFHAEVLRDLGKQGFAEVLSVPQAISQEALS